MKPTTICILLMCVCCGIYAQNSVLSIEFDKPILDWDGFGVNYVETRHTRDYTEFPQDYGGFKYLTEEQRTQIIDLVFGKDGLKPGILKMFVDPFHEPENDNDNPYKIEKSRFDHETTTQWMMYFAEKGVEKVNEWGGHLTVLAGMYGPPAWITTQKSFRGRDLDPAMKEEFAEYLVEWARYLKHDKGFDVKYISPHNEGEPQKRWTKDGIDNPGMYAHDYNMFWPAWQTVDFLKYADNVLYHNNMLDVGLTCGEASSWKRLYTWMNHDSIDTNLALAIREDPEAMMNLDLITSHGFYREYEPEGVKLLRQANPALHAWTTSYTWGDMTVEIIEDARNLIYTTNCNGLIPWATIHNDFESDKLSPPAGNRISSNANSPIATNNNGVQITKAYYYYKLISRAGQPGMIVASYTTDDANIQAIAFGKNRTQEPDAFIILNKGATSKTTSVRISGSSSNTFSVFRTSDPDYGDENYISLGIRKTQNHTLIYEFPPRSATVFFGDNGCQ